MDRDRLRQLAVESAESRDKDYEQIRQGAESYGQAEENLGITIEAYRQSMQELAQLALDYPGKKKGLSADIPVGIIEAPSSEGHTEQRNVLAQVYIAECKGKSLQKVSVGFRLQARNEGDEDLIGIESVSREEYGVKGIPVPEELKHRVPALISTSLEAEVIGKDYMEFQTAVIGAHLANMQDTLGLLQAGVLELNGATV